MKTFVVRLHEDAAGDPGGADIPRLCGVVDEVATGLSAKFRSEHELVAALRAAMVTNRPEPSEPSGPSEPSQDSGDRVPGGSHRTDHA